MSGGDRYEDSENLDSEERVTEVVLSARELAIAKHAAKLAVAEITDNFYKKVGKTLVQRWLIWLGVLVVGYATGKGWLTIPGSK